MRDKKRSKNLVADHLSRLNQEELNKNNGGVPINESFHSEHLLTIASKELPWFTDFANYLVSGVSPYRLDFYKRRNFCMIVSFTIGRNLCFTRDVLMG